MRPVIPNYYRRVLGGLVLLLTVFLFQCNLPGPNQNLEPLPYGEPNRNFADTYYLDADSLVSLTPELSLLPSGSSQAGGLVMKLAITAKVINLSNQTWTVEPGRATVYIHNITRDIKTVLLVPDINTIREQKVDPDESFECHYVNDPIDEIPYDPLEMDYFAVFTLTVNGKERIFVTQIAQPGA